MAQRPGGARGGPTRGKQPKEPPRQRDSRGEGGTLSPGTQTGYILRYKVADEEDKKEDADLLGVLKIKPYGAKTTVMTLQVRRSDDLRITLGEHQFETDELDKVFRKRLDVSADWDFLDPDSKRDDKFKKKVLRTLTFKTTEIEGEVEEVLDGGRAIVSAVPTNDLQWPDYIPDDKQTNDPKKDKVRKKKLKLMVVDDVSKFFTEDSEDADLSDFKQGDKVQALVVYAGSKPGYILKMHPPGAKEATPKPDDNPGERGGARPPQPSGPRPSGRGAPQG
ncbi:MAG: hypothetical protein H6818_04775 [Phycisphaerales bacterium]|nr:hypothetical protein [Phycisphaerales bacterium]